ncbi:MULTISPECIES: hypothetical protein [Streptomyces]|uniref:Uncharacterized protein n=2 Tax=Streptomyces TaxID=1883 RepID=A0ABT9KSY9_9ACTN|nr:MULTISPECIES: hypothetical protein [Streptomyces]MBW8086583.1 hypothetical protein [Streptomyces hygroscopicus subsp. hygroscopicus]MDP9611270.1 hypothetical protein [Streptomyces demainii]
MTFWNEHGRKTLVMGEEHQRPISAETLRKRFHVGAARSRMLVTMVRSANAPQPPGGKKVADVDISGFGT